MSRSREISTEIANDKRLALLALKHGPIVVLFYTLAIPHADDWGRLPGDAMEFALKVYPTLLNQLPQIEEAIEALTEVGLWRRYTADGKTCIAYPRETWFKHQSYINAEKREYDGSKFPAPPGETWKQWEERPSAQRGNKGQAIAGSQDDSRLLPEKAKNHQEKPQNPASPSPSPSPTLSDSPLSPPKGGADDVSGDAEAARVPKPEPLPSGKSTDFPATPSEPDSETMDSTSRRNTGTRVPPDFAYRAEDADWAKETFPWLTDANLNFITDEFRDYWASLPNTRDSRKANWFLTWRNRVRDVARKYQAPSQRSGPSPYPSDSGGGGNYATGPKLQDLTGIGGDKPIRSFPIRRPGDKNLTPEVRQ